MWKTAPRSSGILRRGVMRTPSMSAIGELRCVIDAEADELVDGVGEGGVGGESLTGEPVDGDPVGLGHRSHVVGGDQRRTVPGTGLDLVLDELGDLADGGRPAR